MFSALMAFVHLILMGGTFILTLEYYDKIKEGLIIPSELHYIVYGGVFGVSVLWALGNALLGAAMGIAAGGAMDGIRMGLTLGVGLSVGRLWPYIFTFAGGAFYSGAATWVVVISVIAGIACFFINRMMNFIWSSTSGS